MKYPAFWNALAAHQKSTRYMVLSPGDVGQTPITKVGGTPWWPSGVARPSCPYGHAMSFMMQIRLSDIFELGQDDPGLLSFHYCQECMYEGLRSAPSNIPDLYNPWDDTGYDLRVFYDSSGHLVDGLGVIAEDVLRPYHVELIERLETPSLADIFSFPEVDALLPHPFPHFKSRWLAVMGARKRLASGRRW